MEQLDTTVTVYEMADALYDNIGLDSKTVVNFGLRAPNCNIKEVYHGTIGDIPYHLRNERLNEIQIITVVRKGDLTWL